MQHRTLSTWIVLKNPRDYPGKFVVREDKVTTGFVSQGLPRPCNSLSEALALIPEGKVELGRMTGDDPVIYTTFI